MHDRRAREPPRLAQAGRLRSARYELLLRNFEAGDDRIPWNPIWMPNRKTDTNNNFAISTDDIGMNYDYPEADYATREQIIAEHRDYQHGLMWTLANNPRVPEKVRRQFQRLGPGQGRVHRQRQLAAAALRARGAADGRPST